MKHRWRRLAAPITIALLVTAACGGGDDEQAGETENPISLRMTVWTSNEAHLEILNEIGAEFAAASPDVDEVTIETTPADEDYRTVLTAQIGGGDAPDVGWLQELHSAEFIAGDALVDLSETLGADPDYNFGDLAEEPMSLWTEGDGVYGVPFSTSPLGLFYNADMFTAAGLPTPEQMQADGTWTWENLAAAAKEIHDTQDVAGFSVGGYKFNENFQFLSVIWYGFGAAPWSEDGQTCTMADPEMVEAMEFLHSMIFEDGSHPGPGELVDYFTGQAAMTTAFISQANQLGEVDWEWGVAPLPAGPQSEAAVIGQSAVVAFSAGDHPQQAAEFVAFMTNEENSRKLSAFFPSIRGELLSVDVLAEKNPVLNEQQLEKVVIEGISNGRTTPTHANIGEIRPELRTALEPMWEPDADISVVLQDACDTIEPLLETS